MPETERVRVMQRRIEAAERAAAELGAMLDRLAEIAAQLGKEIDPHAA